LQIDVNRFGFFLHFETLDEGKETRADFDSTEFGLDNDDDDEEPIEEFDIETEDEDDIERCRLLLRP